jgi:hypothetical protein
MLKRVVILVLAFALFAMSVNAFQFSAVIDHPEKITKITEAATFELVLTHDSATDEKFELYSPDVEWDVTTTPARPITVPHGQATTVLIHVRPLYVTTGFYAVTLTIRHVASGQLERKTIIVGVESKNYVPGQYVPALRLKTNVLSQVDPREPVVITVDLSNGNPRNLQNITFKIHSNLLNAEIVEDLPGLERKQLVIPIRLPATTPPQHDVLRVTGLVQDGDTVIPFDAEPVEYDAAAEKSSFLKTDTIYTLTNTGNNRKSTEFALKSNPIAGWFTSSEPQSHTITRADGTYDAWDITLNVGEQTTIRVTTNYRPLLIIILIFGFAVGCYYVFRSPLVVRKSAVVIAAKEGGMSELKVLIEVSNRSARAIKQLKIIDKVPHIAEVASEFDVGTMRPTSVKQLPNKGTLITWHIDELDAGEERVITYKIRSKLSILGQMRLPIAMTHFETSHGNHRRTKSNISQIGFGN